MAQRGAISAAQHGRHPSPSLRHPAHADDVYAPMKLVQPSLLQAAHNGPPPHPQLKQLLPSHNAVLAPRQPLHLPLKKLSGQLSTNTVPN